MTTKRDYYEILGVEKSASVEQIKKSYRKLALANHPDRNPGDEQAVERFKEASEAFEVLSSEEKRARYDRFGHAGVSGANGRGGGFHDVEDIFDAFGDLFEGFGGFGGRRQRGGRRGRRGESLAASVTIDLHEAARGCTRTIEIDRRELCDTCDGSGAKPGTTPATCDYCGGQGQVVQSHGFFRVQTTCPSCQGAGTVIRERCGNCNGSGRQMKTSSLEVKIPAGIDNGMQLCLRGEGEPGLHGGGRGDLYLDIKVKPHPLFKRDGRNLLCKMPLTYSQAALGTKLDVPVLEGRHTLQIQPGTQPGHIIRLPGKGMPDPHGRTPGDLLVEIQLEVPAKLSEREEELLRELAELEHKAVSPHRKSFFEQLKDYFTSHSEAEDN